MKSIGARQLKAPIVRLQWKNWLKDATKPLVCQTTKANNIQLLEELTELFR